MSEEAILSWVMKELSEHADRMGPLIIDVTDPVQRGELMREFKRFHNHIAEGLHTFLGTEAPRD